MSGPSLEAQVAAFRIAAGLASTSLSKWLGRPVHVSVQEVHALPLEEAMSLLGQEEGTICGCAMSITGSLRGLLVMICDDDAGLGLADMLLRRDPGTAVEWGEMEQSAVVETANIIGCAYLNAMANSAAATTAAMPSPPWFLRDYAAAVMQGIVMSRPQVCETVFLTRTEFGIEASPVRCSLIFLPDPDDAAGAAGATP